MTLSTTRVCEPVDLDELDDMEKVEEERQKSSGAAKTPVDLNELEEQKKSTMDHTTTSGGHSSHRWCRSNGYCC